MDTQFDFIDDKITLDQLIKSSVSEQSLIGNLYNITSFTRMKRGLSTTRESEVYYLSDGPSDTKALKIWLRSVTSDF